MTGTRTIDQLVQHALAEPEPELSTEEFERRKNEARRRLEETYGEEIAAEEKARAETQAARTTTQEGEGMAKETISFGVAGTLDGSGFKQEPRARITFQATADYSSVTEKFGKNGDVDLGHVLTIDPGTFSIIRVDEPAVQEKLEDAG